MELKRYKKKTIGSYLSFQIIIIITSILFSFYIINHFANKYNDVLLSLAEVRARKYLTTIINDSTKNVKFDGNLFVIDKGNDNEIKMINYNSYEATYIINVITDNIQDKLNDDDRYIITDIPIGAVFKNGLLRNMGPKIKVRLELIGDIISELQTEVKPYGINNALVEVRINVVANARIILPIISKDITVNNMIPISINIVNGKVPEAYISSYR